MVSFSCSTSTLKLLYLSYELKVQAPQRKLLLHQIHLISGPEQAKLNWLWWPAMEFT
jgi:hypothetical protein